MSATAPPNQDQAANWNSANGQTWVQMKDLLDRLFDPVAARVIDAGFPGAGGRVLDIGCGAGATTLAMAARLGPGGACLGIDISRPLVEAATRRAAEAGAGQGGAATARFLAADAQTHAFDPGAFDAAMSRFGVMFFDDPAAAFANIRRALRPGGKLAFAAWRSPAQNPFMTAAGRAAAPLLPAVPAAAPDAPGQFGFAREAHVREVLSAAGWSEVAVRPIDLDAALDEADLGAYVARMGAVGQALRALDETARAPIRQAVRCAYEPFVQGGVARFTLACWLVTARA